MKALDKIQEHKRRTSLEEVQQEPVAPGTPGPMPGTATAEDAAMSERPGPARQPAVQREDEGTVENEADLPSREQEEEPFAEEPEPETDAETIAQPPDAGFEGLTAVHTEAADTSSLENRIAPEGIYADTLVLLKYALGTGKRMPEKVKELLRHDTLSSIIQVHQELSYMIRPAIPGSVLYLAEQKTRYRRLKFLGPVPVVCYLMLVGILSFLTLVFSSCSPMVNEANLAHGLLNSSGLVLLVNLLFISSVSCLGAVFSILPKVNEQIRQATYLPGSDMHYWSTLMLGIFGGLIMGELLSLSYDIPGTPMKFDTIVFALMGGFASESVFLILKSIMAKIQQLVAGDAREDIH